MPNSRRLPQSIYLLWREIYHPSFASVTVFGHGPKNPSINTKPKTNMSPENQWLEDVFPIKIPFKGDVR